MKEDQEEQDSESEGVTSGSEEEGETNTSKDKVEMADFVAVCLWEKKKDGDRCVNFLSNLYEGSQFLFLTGYSSPPSIMHGRFGFL